MNHHYMQNIKVQTQGLQFLIYTILSQEAWFQVFVLEPLVYDLIEIK